jgi:AcrR family transcriptional regulator
VWEDLNVRGRILDAGERIFAEKGYAGTTVDEVITAALTSRATFRYFRSKDDLFLELSRRCFFEMRTFDQAIRGS